MSGGTGCGLGFASRESKRPATRRRRRRGDPADGAEAEGGPTGGDIGVLEKETWEFCCMVQDQVQGFSCELLL